MHGALGPGTSQPLCALSIHSPGKYLLSTYYVPRAGLGAVDAARSETDTAPVSMGPLFLGERHSVNNEMNEQVSFYIIIASLKHIKQGFGREQWRGY